MTKLIASCSFDYNEESKEITMTGVDSYKGNNLTDMKKEGDDWTDDEITEYNRRNYAYAVGFSQYMLDQFIRTKL